MTTTIIAFVSVGLAASEGDGPDRFVAVHDGVTSTIEEWFVPSAPPERLPVQDRACRAVFFTEGGEVDVETLFCASEVSREVRDVAEGWSITVDGAPDRRTELFEVWFVYPGRTGPQEVRVLARQAYDVDWTLPAGVDPMQFTVDNRPPFAFPPAAADLATNDTSCRVDVEISATGLPSDVWVSECDAVFRDHTERALRRWRYQTPMLDGAPFKVGLTLGVDFTRVYEGANAPGVAVVRMPDSPDMQGRVLADSNMVEADRVIYEAPPLPRATPLFATRTEPYAEVEVYQVAHPEPLEGRDEVACPLVLGVDSVRRQQVWPAEGCLPEVFAHVEPAARQWMLKAGDAEGSLYARMPLTFVFPGDGEPYAQIAAGKVTRPPSGGWPERVVAVSKLKTLTRVAPKLPRGFDADPARCVVTVEVSTEGKPTDIALVSCPDAYVQPSLKAIRRWRWTPAVEDGAPVPATTTVSLRYN